LNLDQPSRRSELRSLGCIVLLLLGLAGDARSAAAQRYSLAADDRALLEDVSHRAFRYFWEQADPNTGLVLDRARADGSPHDEIHRRIASIAATGFALTALCIAAERGWIEPRVARERVRATLRFFSDRAPQEHGWFYHWMDVSTGERAWNSEVSSIDTALLLAGALTAKQAFSKDADIVRLATRIYERTDFLWMQNGSPVFLTHGWKPESGFLNSLWDDYSEETLLYLLAIGSPTHPISPRAWWGWKRTWINYDGYSYLAGAVPLFIHQYSHAWVDFRGLVERHPPHIDYFDNSVIATRAQRAFCIDLSKEFPGYSDNVWGITASDSIRGYVAWGGPPRDPAIDGTVVPCAAGGSLMFTPEISLAALKEMKNRFGATIYRKYGFVDAFNPGTGWTDTDVIGIDVGIMLLSAENLRSGSVWRWFMRNPEIPRALRLVGLVPEHPGRRRPRQQSSSLGPSINQTILEIFSNNTFDLW
jgi:hypothetical protein